MSVRHCTVRITGITCIGCVWPIEMSLSALPGVRSASVDYAEEVLTVVYDGALLRPHDILSRLRSIGHEAVTTTLEFGIEAGAAAAPQTDLQALLAQTDGVLTASVDAGCERVRVSCIPAMISVSDLTSLIRNAGYNIPIPPAEAAPADETIPVTRDTRAREKARIFIGIALTLPLVAVSMARDMLNVSFHGDILLLFVLATLVQVLIGGRFYAGALRGLRAGHPDMDVLVVLGSSIAYLSSLGVSLGLLPGSDVYYETGAVIVTLIRVGKYLEMGARARAGGAFERLLATRPETCTVLRDGAEYVVAYSDVRVGDLLRILPGERIPVDGIITRGSSRLDESMITGEMMPVSKGPGDTVTGATLNHDGQLYIEATRVGADTRLAQIARLVRDARTGRAPLRKLTDEVGRYLVPVIIGFAACTCVGWMVVAEAGWSVAMMNTVAVLVIACPCAIGLAAPTAVMAGMAGAAEAGVLFRSGDMLERAGQAHIVVFDKTGTLTTGTPRVTDILPCDGYTPEEVLRLAASVERGTDHPISRALAKEAEARAVFIVDAEDVRTFGGSGVRGTIASLTVAVGNESMARNDGVDTDALKQLLEPLQTDGKTTIIVTARERGSDTSAVPVGIIAVADTVRPDAAAAVADLKTLGIDMVLLTGDSRRAADALAGQLGIPRVLAERTPEQKARAIQELQEACTLGNYAHPTVMMVGDGINDAPALAQADVGISFGSGTDIAQAAAGVTILSNEVGAVTQAILRSRATSQTIIQNLVWALLYNVALIPIAAYGLLVPMAAAGAMVCSSLFMVTNSLYLRRTTLRSDSRVPTAGRMVLRQIPRLAGPALALGLLIVVPMVSMSEPMEIRGAIAGAMTSPAMMVMAIANGLIAVSYSSIPFFLIIFVRKRTDMPFTWVLFLFGLFILACGITHMVHVVGVWRPVDAWQALVDSLCAAVSFATAIALWPTLPKLLAIPSPTQLRTVNAALEREKDKLLETQQALQRAYNEADSLVATRTHELREANARLRAEIDERIRAEENLRTSEAYFRSIFENSLVGFSITNPDGTLRTNATFRAMLGYSEAELASRNWMDITHPDDVESSLLFVAQVMRGDVSAARFEKRYITKSGQVIWVDLATVLRRDAAGEPLYFITAMQDITARKQLEMKLRDANIHLEERVAERTAQVEAVNKELEAFCYSVSHDLRAPLRHLDGYVELLLENTAGQLDETGSRYAGCISTAARQMGGLIDDLLKFSRTAKSELTKRPVVMNTLVQDIVSVLDQIHTQRVIHWTIGELPDAPGERNLLRQVWTNLLDNAVKYTRQKEQARISIKGRDAGTYAEYTVSDNGAGFDMQYAGKLFGVFQRLHTSTEFEGNGIGLATVQRIILRHGGRVWAEAELNRGATFHFTLPYEPEENNG
ncbi:MAG: heavy metal translocating P-type ATPase [Ignavibacteriae bacterium]|nr:heavy metal translocating P-type ATPase [Ignavibacteriota bacterium]